MRTVFFTFMLVIMQVTIVSSAYQPEQPPTIELRNVQQLALSQNYGIIQHPDKRETAYLFDIAIQQVSDKFKPIKYVQGFITSNRYAAIMHDRGITFVDFQADLSLRSQQLQFSIPELNPAKVWSASIADNYAAVNYNRLDHKNHVALIDLNKGDIVKISNLSLENVQYFQVAGDYGCILYKDGDPIFINLKTLSPMIIEDAKLVDVHDVTLSDQFSALVYQDKSVVFVDLANQQAVYPAIDNQNINHVFISSPYAAIRYQDKSAIFVNLHTSEQISLPPAINLTNVLHVSMSGSYVAIHYHDESVLKHTEK